MRGRTALVIGLGLACGACADPVHEDAVAALGPEAPGVPIGPSHRPGQPCPTCHGGDGPGHPTMAFAGTVFSGAKSDVVVPGALVRVVGANGATYQTESNCAGNFWAPAEAFHVDFPAAAAVTVPGSSRVMLTPMHRSSSCSDCHTARPSPTSPGRLWVDPPATPRACDPEFPGGTAGVEGDRTGTRPDCSGPVPSYSRDVAPLLAERCTPCHRQGGQESTPDFSSYPAIDDLQKHTKKLQTAQSRIILGQMPPPPLPVLTEEERRLLFCWLGASGGPPNN